MMLLTVLAATAVVVGTGFVAVGSDSSKQNYMNQSSGDSYVVLAMCSSGNLKTFEKIVHSEIDDTPGDGLPGYNVVVRDCQTYAEGAWRRFRSYLQEAKNASNRGPRAGVVLDAYGLLAMIISFAKPGGDQYLPDFVVAISPIDSTTNLNNAYETMACNRPGEPTDNTIEELEKLKTIMSEFTSEEKAAVETNVSKIEKIVLASIESPFGEPEYMQGVSRGTPTRGFLTFDKNNVCASWMKGGYTSEELAQARVERESIEKESRQIEPRFTQEVAEEASRLKNAVFRGEVKGRKYCKGLLKSAVDELVKKILATNPDINSDINDVRRNIFDSAERRMVAEQI